MCSFRFVSFGGVWFVYVYLLARMPAFCNFASSRGAMLFMCLNGGDHARWSLMHVSTFSRVVSRRFLSADRATCFAMWTMETHFRAGREREMTTMFINWPTPGFIHLSVWLKITFIVSGQKKWFGMKTRSWIISNWRRVVREWGGFEILRRLMVGHKNCRKYWD